MSGDWLTILAVDDEQTQLQDLARLLRRVPAVKDVECVSDGHDALLRCSHISQPGAYDRGQPGVVQDESHRWRQHFDLVVSFAGACGRQPHHRFAVAVPDHRPGTCVDDFVSSDANPAMLSGHGKVHVLPGADLRLAVPGQPGQTRHQRLEVSPDLAGTPPRAKCRRADQ